jgi:hypothetical protein
MFWETDISVAKPHLTSLFLTVLISLGVLPSYIWGQGSTSNGNGSIQERTSSDLWSADRGVSGSGASLSVAGPWVLGQPSQNGSGATADVGNVGGAAGSSSSPTPTPSPTDSVTPGPSPTPTDTPAEISSPTPSDTPTEGPSPTPTPTATCDVTNSDFDLVLDGVVNAEDLLGFLTELESGTFSSDFNCDGTSDSLDLFLMAEKWGIAFTP